MCEQKVFEKTKSKKDFGYASVVCKHCEKTCVDLAIFLNKKSDLLLTWTDKEEGIIHHKLIPKSRRNGITEPIVEPIIA